MVEEPNLSGRIAIVTGASAGMRTLNDALMEDVLPPDRAPGRPAHFR